MTTPQSKVAPFLDKFRGLDFVRNLQYSIPTGGKDTGADGVLEIKTPKGSFAFLVSRRNSYLDRALLNAFILQAKQHVGKKRKPWLLFARYIPRPSAERLIRSGVNFLDQAGNMHLALGDNYVRTVLGNKEGAAPNDEKSITPANIQLLFTLAASETRDWTVRGLAKASGVSKSNIAKLRRQLVNQGILQKIGTSFQLRSGMDTEDRLVRGYEQVLRPKLVFNRFRSAESSSQVALEKLRRLLDEHSIRWSLTGGAAAFELQRLYKGQELVLFVDNPTETTARQMRLLPDREGPITILRSFGSATHWKQINETMVAHPWLIYAELMSSPDPRAHEAAAEIKSEFLKA